MTEDIFAGLEALIRATKDNGRNISRFGVFIRYVDDAYQVYRMADDGSRSILLRTEDPKEALKKVIAASDLYK